MILPALFLAPSGGRGRGVFTQEAIPEGTVIEIAPVIVMSAQDRSFIDQTKLHDYIFVWGEKVDRCAMALGYVPMYNHSAPSNCEYEMEWEAELIRIKTVRHIQAGEELFINYQGDWNSDEPVWFNAK
jgi:SET domain-containing protein